MVEPPEILNNVLIQLRIFSHVFLLFKVQRRWFHNDVRQLWVWHSLPRKAVASFNKSQMMRISEVWWLRTMMMMLLLMIMIMMIIVMMRMMIMTRDDSTANWMNCKLLLPRYLCAIKTISIISLEDSQKRITEDFPKKHQQLPRPLTGGPVLK